MLDSIFISTGFSEKTNRRWFMISQYPVYTVAESKTEAVETILKINPKMQLADLKEQKDTLTIKHNGENIEFKGVSEGLLGYLRNEINRKKANITII